MFTGFRILHAWIWKLSCYHSQSLHAAIVMLEQYDPLLGYPAVLSLQEAHIRAGGRRRILTSLNNCFVYVWPTLQSPGPLTGNSNSFNGSRAELLWPLCKYRHYSQPTELLVCPLVNINRVYTAVQNIIKYKEFMNSTSLRLEHHASSFS